MSPLKLFLGFRDPPVALDNLPADLSFRVLRDEAFYRFADQIRARSSLLSCPLVQQGDQLIGQLHERLGPSHDHMLGDDCFLAGTQDGLAGQAGLADSRPQA